jgi:hypothetical protein
MLQANTLVEKQRGQLVTMHKDGCPWKTQQCDGTVHSLPQLLDGSDVSHLDSVYRLPVQSPSAAAKEIKSRALGLEPVLEEVQVKHPLVGVVLFGPQAKMTANSSHSLPHRYTP